MNDSDLSHFALVGLTSLSNSPDLTAMIITVDEFRARLKTLDIEAGFAIAVSGGRDSMALARLAVEHAAKTGISILALTVDHGLREESHTEAKRVADWCTEIGLPHKTLSWTGKKPKTGIQEAAREARYGLLARAAQEAGFDTLLTAHSADDQAETMFMRLARGAGPRGLGAMNDRTFIAANAGERIRLLRPLLGYSRARLTKTVKAYGQSYVDDPSNDDPAYERIRTRALLAALEQQNLLTQKSLLRSAGRMRKAHQRAKAHEDILFRKLGGCFYGWSGVSLDQRACAEVGVDEATGLFRRLVFAVSGQSFAPDDGAIEGAFQSVMTTGAATLGGALLKLHDDGVWFLREPAALLGRAGVAPLEGQPISPGQKCLWDNRFIISVPIGGQGGVILPLGKRGIEVLAAKTGLFQGPREGLLTIPVLCGDDALIGAPALLSMSQEGLLMDSLLGERFQGQTIRFS